MSTRLLVSRQAYSLPLTSGWVEVVLGKRRSEINEIKNQTNTNNEHKNEVGHWNNTKYFLYTHKNKGSVESFVE